jgi:biotin---protein ligase
LDRFAAVNLEPKPEPSFFPQVVQTLDHNDDLRNNFLTACLEKLGLEVNQKQNVVPSLSRLHLSSLVPGETSDILSKLKEIISVENGEELIKDENDTFLLEKSSALDLSGLTKSLPESGVSNELTDSKTNTEDRILDYSKVVKRILPHVKDYPSVQETPYFNHGLYYEHLESYQESTPDADVEFGSHLLYGEVVTSTNTLLEK